MVVVNTCAGDMCTQYGHDCRQVTDSDDKERNGILQEVLTTCMYDYEYILPLYSKMRERKRGLAIAAGDGMEFVNVKQLQNLDSDYVVNYVCSKSDITVEELVDAMVTNPTAAHQLLVFGVQHPLSMRWPSELIAKDLTSRWFDTRVAQCGSRLKDIKTKGVFVTKNVDWSQGCYRPEFDGENRLIVIQHVNGEKAKMPDHVCIRKGNFEFTHNWDDFAAALVVPLLPDLKLHTLFTKDGAGPYRYLIYQKKSPDFIRALGECASGFNAEKEALMSSSTYSTAASEKISDLKTAKAKQRAQVARSNALLALKEKKTR